MCKPLISVIMPAYNSEKYISQAIDSVLGQTCGDFEFLICDDASDDKTYDIVSHYTDSRIRGYSNQENLGVTQTLNDLIQKSSGRYIARMDADDCCRSDRFVKQLDFLKINCDIGVCGSWFYSIRDGSKNLVQTPEDNDSIRFQMLFDCPFCHPSIMFRSAIAKDKNLYYDEYYTHVEDYEYWVRLSYAGIRLANIAEPLIDYRLHGGSVGSTHSIAQQACAKKVRLLQLERLGIVPSDAEYNLHSRAIPDVAQDLDMIRAYGQWLQKMMGANQCSKIYGNSRFALDLADRWWWLCSLATHHGVGLWRIFRAAPDLLSPHASKNDLLKMYLKCLVRVLKTMFCLHQRVKQQIAKRGCM